MTSTSMGQFLTKIGGFASNNGAEIPAFDPGSDRLFVVAGDLVEILDLADPTSPSKIGDLVLNLDGLTSGFSPVPNSVAVGKAGTPSAGVIAVALAVRDDLNNQEAGQVQFFNAATGNFLGKVLVGFLPDMVTFTPDGTKILVANEGEPNESYTVDPVGSVSIVDITGGFANLAAQTASFDSFNDQKSDLRSAGVRLFGEVFDDNGNFVRESTVAEDLEPEYIAFNGDGTKAWVTLQENNAVAVIDIATATVESILPLGFKDHNSVNVSNLETFEFTNLPAIGTTTAGQEILLGGFSGLFYEGTAANGNLKFVTHTDRGPNGEPTGSNRPFLLPDFSPEIIRFELNRSTGAIAITQRLSIKQADGTPITGLPNLAVTGGTGNTTYNDEVPVDLSGNTITPLDNLGGDLEGIVVAGDGTFWMVDEYRPAIYHFDTQGKLIDRFVPVGTAAAVGQSAGDFGDEVLPAVLAQRRQNRGFEAIALDSDTNKLYAFVQSPLRNPETLSNGNLNSLNNIRIVEFDLASKTVTAEYLYRMDNPNLGTPGNTRPDKIGDAVYIGNGEFLVVERDDDAIDSDPLSNIEKKVYRFSLDGATNITGQNGTFDVGGGVLKSIDQMTPAELATQGISLVGKVLHVDLAQAGYNTVEKVEGLALIDANTIAVLNDNDFQVAGITIDTATGTFTPDPDPEPLVLGIISLNSNGFDASDRDGGIINIRNWPVFGMYMPDSISSFTAGGQTYYVTANEGDARLRPSGDDVLPTPFDGEGDIFSEEARVKDLILDPIAFPNAAELQADSAIGRLTVTTKLGDTDGDGDFDELYAFGSRSFSIWDSTGNLVYDSGEDFERITAAAFPNFFNASNNNNSFDNRSDNKGPEPEGVTVGTINGRTYAFIGLERIGGVMVYDVTHPQDPEFIEYINTRNFSVDPESNLTDSGPEGLVFVSAEDSPNGQPLLVVSNEVSKTTAIFEVNVPAPRPFTLQLFHASDQEAGVPALDDIPRFSAVLNALLQQDIDNDSVAGFANTLILSSGDAYIPGLFLSASEEVFGGAGRADILIQNELGFQAIAFGNHEFDLGTALIKDLIAGDSGDNFPGTNFPYLSSNLDFSTDANLAGLVVPNHQAPRPNSIAATTVIDVNGEKIGIVGATTPTINVISSPGGVTISPQPFNGTPTAAQLDALAAEIQADVDGLLAANPNINKVVLLAHMQQIGIEQELATRLKHVDIIVAGGSNTRLVDENDRLRAGDTAQGIYPIIKTDADGNPVAVVNTDGNYKYLGRLVIDFNENGIIVPESYDPNISGAYATDDQGVADLNAAGLIDPEIQTIVDQLREVIVATESNVFGVSNVYLEGLRPAIRQQETNLGNLTADANLAIAKTVDSSVVISLKNGGGIRNDIGRIVIPTGSTGEVERLPNEAVTDAEGNIIKPAGGISETDIANALSFNNGLSLITVTASELLALIEHGVAASDGSNQQGRFPQVSGIAFSFDLNRAPGDRILSLAIEDENGNDIDVVVRNGELVGDSTRTFRMVTLGFLATGGDGYPFPSGDSANLVSLTLPADAPRTGEATFAADGSEQDALAEYLAANFNTPETAFNQADTSPEFDTRIQNLAFRADTVIDPLDPSANQIGVMAQDGFFFVLLPDGSEIELKFGNQPFAANTFGNWQILEAETVNGINQVLWQNPDTNQIGTWNTDANWNWVSSQTWPTNSFNTLKAEVTFQIDLNNDALLGDRLTTVENQGSTTLLEGILGNYYTRTGDSLTTPIKFGGEAFDNFFGDWQGLAAETVNGINQVLFENLTTNQVGVWNTNATWNWVSSSVFAAGSPEALAQAAIFGVDISGSIVA